jgi:hypothetical protein
MGELFGIFIFVDILRLINFQKQMGGVADNIGRVLGREKNGTSFAQADDITHFGSPGTIESGVVQAVFEPLQRDNSLGLESRRAFDKLQGLIHIEGKQEPFQPGGDFILTTLTGDLDRKSEAFAIEDAVEDGVGNIKLIGAETG